jgi:hypothetical protein
MSDYHEGLEEGIKIGRAEVQARIAELEARVTEARRTALEEAIEIAEGQLQNTLLLTSNPPRSSAAWEIQNTIRALMEKKDD